jgi:transposase
MMSIKQISDVRKLQQAGLPIKEITRRTGVSRNTVRKILRSKETKFIYQREPETRPAQDSVKETIKGWLKEDLLERRKYRRTAKRMYDILFCEYGYKGSYASIRRCVRALKSEIQRQSAEIFIPLTFAPGSASQFDWGEVIVIVAGKPLILSLGAMELCYSRYFYARVYQSQKQELFFDIHRRAFEYFGGITKRIIYDNLKSAVKKILRGKHPNLQERFVQFGSHYLFDPEFCNPAKGNEKGRIENLIEYIRQNFFSPILRVSSLEELNDRLLSFCMAAARNRKHPNNPDKTRYDAYEDEKEYFIDLPGHGFDCCRVTQALVTTSSTVFFELNLYSVPGQYLGKLVKIKGYAEEVIIYGPQQEEIARHSRLYATRQHSVNPLHYLEALSRKPRALMDGLPFKGWELPSVFQQYRRLLRDRYDDGDRYFVKTLLLLREWPIKEVAEAISQAIGAGAIGDSCVVAILQHKQDTLDRPLDVDIREKLAKYRATQLPLSRYDLLRTQQTYGGN